jgi:hypothetical protein
MMMVYNSDSYAVMQFDLRVEGAVGEQPRGGYEIVDKFARKEIFLDGTMAQSFREGVEALIRKSPSEDEIDDYIAGYTELAQQPVVLH